mgnify:CR=1 FL=1
MEVTTVREYANYFLCKCPNPHHKDTHPSCILWKDTGKFKCMSCDFAGFADGFESSNYFKLPDFDYVPQYFQPSEEVISYLGERKIRHIPQFVVAPPHNDGVGFLQTHVNGQVIGLSQRMFHPFGENIRYIYQGRKGSYTGDITPFYESNCPIIVFEKMFGMLRAYTVAKDWDIPLTLLSSNGSKLDFKFWQRFNSASLLFIMDNDMAGVKARDFLKKLGFNAFVSRNPTDEISDSEMEKLLNNAKSILLR